MVASLMMQVFSKSLMTVKVLQFVHSINQARKKNTRLEKMSVTMHAYKLM